MVCRGLMEQQILPTIPTIFFPQCKGMVVTVPVVPVVAAAAAAALPALRIIMPMVLVSLMLPVAVAAVAAAAVAAVKAVAAATAVAALSASILITTKEIELSDNAMSSPVLWDKAERVLRAVMADKEVMLVTDCRKWLH